jgi:PAT family beta-lactamase induction signal transducer AmpG
VTTVARAGSEIRTNMATSPVKLSALLALYFSQGLPFGFQVTALPLILRSHGVSLKAIGLASLLSAPWMAKGLWAPFVDRYSLPGIGRRKTWILPMQAGLAVCAFLAGRTEDPVRLVALVTTGNAGSTIVDTC